MLRLLITQIVFLRPQVVPIGGCFNATGVDRDKLMTDAFVPGFREQLLNNPLRLFVPTLAELMMSDPPLRIDDVKRRPIVIIERPPYRKIIVASISAVI